MTILKTSSSQTARCHAILLVFKLFIAGATAVSSSSPVITLPPRDQEAVESQTVRFTCTAEASASSSSGSSAGTQQADHIPSITWWTATDDGTLEALIVTTENISDIETESVPGTDEVRSVLTLRNVLSSYSGAIACQAENSHGNDSVLAVLTVQVPAKILAHPSNITINDSNSAYVVCVAYGDPLPVLTWQSEDGRDLPPNTTFTQAVRVVEEERFVVSILEMCDLDSFISASVTISCVASNNVTNGVAMETKSFTIQFQDNSTSPPFGSHDLVAIVGEENYTISFNISEADPPVAASDITWMFVTVDGTEDGSVFSYGVFSLDRASFTMERVEFHHEGVYVFTASNGAAGYTRESINIDVQGAPKQYGQTVREILAVEQASNVELVCVIAADPAPAVQWMFNDVALNVSNTDKYNVTVVSSQSHGYVVTNTTLEIHNIQFQEFGNYSCLATNRHGNETSTFQVQLQGCPSTQTVIPRLGEDGIDILLDWPEGEVGVNNSLPCPCGANLSAAFVNGGPHAYRYCRAGGNLVPGGGGIWGEPLMEYCNFSSVGRKLCQITAEKLQADPEWVLDRTYFISTKSNIFEALDFTIISKLFDKMATFLLNKENRTMEMVEKLLSIVENIMAVDPDAIRESQETSLSATRILRTVERIGLSIPIPENETEQIISFPSFAVSVREVDPGDFSGQTFSVSLEGDSSNISRDSLKFGGQSTTMTSTSIKLPEDLFEQIESSHGNQLSRIRIVHTLFLSDVLFVQRREEEDKVGSAIISASIGGLAEVVGISDPPILITLAKRGVTNDSETDPYCNYWDFEEDDGFGDWSTRGCVLVNETKLNVVCACDHLTNFALLLDVSPKLGNNTKKVSKELAKTLLAASYIGAIVSIIFLAITIATYSLSKKLRSTINGKLLINLCVGFIGIYFMFIVSYHLTPWHIPCAIAGGLLHYFMLVTFAIMAAEAISLYIHLVVVLGWNTVKSHYTLKTTLIAWILPGVIVLASFAPNYKNYIGEQLCRPYGVPFYAALIGPFVLVYLFNWVMFIVIIASLIRNAKKRNKNKSKSSSFMFKRHLIIAIGLSLFFGLGWGLGLPATNAISNIPGRVLLQILFIFLSGFQGVFIFLMQCARSEDARKEWSRWLKKLTCGTIDIGSGRSLGHSNANVYKKNSSDLRYSCATMAPRTSSTSAGNSETLQRKLRPHYNSRSNLMVYGSQSSLVSITEDTRKEVKDENSKNLDLSVVYENVVEEDGAELEANKQLDEDTQHVDECPPGTQTDDHLQVEGEPEIGGQIETIV